MNLQKRSLNRGIMQQILDSFVELTGFRAAFFLDYIELINGQNKSIGEFCRQVKHVAALNDGCKLSDRQAFSMARNSDEPYVFMCHMGLWEAVVPIKVRGNLAGYLMFGQIKGPADVSDNWQGIETKLRGSGLPQDMIGCMERAYKAIPETSREKILAAAKMLEIIARYIIDTEVIHFYDMEAVEKARLFALEHYCEPISIHDLATSVGLSASYLSFLFKRATGQSVTAFITRERMELARQMLRETSLSIKEIAFRCGYADQNYFSRTFKTIAGLSPQNYREVNRSLPQ